MSGIDVKFKNKPKILGLDISTKTIGFALFDMTGSKLLELTHFSPKIKPQPDDKIEELIKKADAFKEHLQLYKDLGIVQVVIEEPLLNSNNKCRFVSEFMSSLRNHNTMLFEILLLIGVVDNVSSNTTGISTPFELPVVAEIIGIIAAPRTIQGLPASL